MKGCGTVFNPVLNEGDELVLQEVARLAKKLAWQAEQIEIAITRCRTIHSIEGLTEMVAFVFNAQQYTPNFGGGGDQLPPGKGYKVAITDSGKDATKGGDGGFLFVKCSVVEGPLMGRSQMIRFNLHHTNPTTVQIANDQLSALCHVVGVFNMQDTQQLHDRPFLIDVDWQKNNEPSQAKPEGGYTEVKQLYDLNGNKAGAANGSQPQHGGQPQQPITPPAGGVQPQGSWGGDQQQQGGQPQQQPQGQGQFDGPPPPQQQQGGQQGGWGGAPANGGQPQQQQQQQPNNGGGWGGNGGQPQQQGGGWGAT